MDNDPFTTQSDVGSAVVRELRAAGFDDAFEIGRGGFGIVFRCTQVDLDRTVAIKVLTGELDVNRQRFLREQRAMGRLTGHPNIVGVLQVGETDSGHPYLVMQYHRQGSLEARIRRLGALALPDVLRLGVKLAGALETAHRLGILHRDVKPANVLLTDYGEPALSDFGIAHITGGFKTATGTFTGSPAFTAPETLSGDPPSRESDVYSLGATLFAALTGHAAFERRSGEQLIAQFLRIASESAPDLRDSGIPGDVAAVVETAMSRDPRDRPSVVALGEELQKLQSKHGVAVDDMALRVGVEPARPQVAAPAAPRQIGNLPLELTTFIGRSAELSAVKRMLTSSRLVTLTGIGGVGKTRLALRAAADAAPTFPDGAWLVELGELHDGSVLADVVAGSLGLRDDPARPLRDMLIDYLCARRLLLVLDNCEQVVDAAAKLADAMLRACPNLRILATSRENLGIGGEAVLCVSPLAFPDAETDTTLGGMPGFDAIALFADRAAVAVPGFELTDQNKSTIAGICSRLEGLPLALELAAARLRAISPEQILDRLGDRYSLLTRGSRDAPQRQQTLSWSVGWSYDLCKPSEQELWARLSVFAGSFELQAAEDICDGDFAPEDVLDLLSSLVDKSILTRTESDGVVRYRMLETLRDYGRERIDQTGELTGLRRKHAEWYRRLIIDAEADWISPQQVYWLKRLECEAPNIRAALEFSHTDSPETALEMAGAIQEFGNARGRLTETRRWLERTLANTAPAPTIERIRALYGAAMIAATQRDISAAEARLTDGRALAAQMTDSDARGMVAIAEGYITLVRGELEGACSRFEEVLETVKDPTLRLTTMVLLGWVLEFRGDIGPALIWQEKALALAESHGESVYREYALWSLGIGWWRHRKPDRAEELLKEALRLTHLVDDPRQAAACMQGLAWIAAERGDHRRAAVLLASAETLIRALGASTVVFPHLLPFHTDCERRTREALEPNEFEAASQEGRSLGFEEAITYALGSPPSSPTAPTRQIP